MANFKTDGMTVEQILSLGDEVLNGFSQRELSHALRTVALAANKRINRLEKQATKTAEGWESNASKKGIAVDALNAVSDDAKRKNGGRFYVGDKNRNQIYAELSRAREFMNMKTSTVSGAVEVRKQREKRLFGKTREEAKAEEKKKQRKKKKTETAATPTGNTQTSGNIANDYEQRLKDTYKAYREYCENHFLKKGQESSTALKEIGRVILSGSNKNEAIEQAENKLKEEYNKEQDERNKAFNNGFGKYFTNRKI